MWIKIGEGQMVNLDKTRQIYIHPAVNGFYELVFDQGDPEDLCTVVFVEEEQVQKVFNEIRMFMNRWNDPTIHPGHKPMFVFDIMSH